MALRNHCRHNVTAAEEIAAEMGEAAIASIDACVGHTVAEFGGIDILINNTALF